MTKKLPVIGLLLLGSSLVSGVLAGCTGDGDKGQVIHASASDLKSRSVAERKRIQDDPRMPPQAKAAALAAMDREERNYQMMPPSQRTKAPLPR